MWGGKAASYSDFYTNANFLLFFTGTAPSVLYDGPTNQIIQIFKENVWLSSIWMNVCFSSRLNQINKKDF